MELYLYDTVADEVRMKLEDVASYSADQIRLKNGAVYGPLAENLEMSATPDCAGTLRADWRRDNPNTETRLEELEALLAEILFGGEA